MLGPFATASRRTPLFYIAIHQVSLLSHATCAIDVHNNDDDNNDNAWQSGPLWRHRMGPIILYPNCVLVEGPVWEVV